MKVNFGKTVPISTVDWRGRSTCTLFFNGCPFRCIYCQNHKLVDGVRWVDIETVKKDIVDSEKFISAAVLSGGEPAMQQDGLVEITEFIKNRGLLVGIHTNGYFPETLKELIRNRLVDKIFLDIKVDPLDPKKYGQIVGRDTVDIVPRVIQSLHMVGMETDIDIEVRTTIFRFINDSMEIAKYLLEHNYNGEYVIQQGVPWNSQDNNIRKYDILNRNEMISIAKNISLELGLKGVKIRTNEKGEEDIIRKSK